MSQDNTPSLQQLADEPGVIDQHGDAAGSKIAELLGRLPNLLSSRPVILFGILLFFYLFIFAGIATLLGYPTAVSTNTQLILGNYTNVSSSVGAGIAAGASLTLVKRQHHAHKLTRPHTLPRWKPERRPGNPQAPAPDQPRRRRATRPRSRRTVQPEPSLRRRGR